MSGPPCPGCEKPGRPWVTAEDRNHRTVPDHFAYFQCAGCGVRYIDPVPEDLGRFYPATYHQVPRTREGFAAGAAIEAFKVELVAAHDNDRGKLLDVGPGGGGFSYLAQEHGYEVEVLEMNARVCADLERSLGVVAHNRVASPAALSSLGPYDVITMWQVLEHVEDPRGLIEAAACALGPNGVLVVAAPNPCSMQLRVLGRRWPHLDAPRHLRLFPAETVAGWASPAGLDKVDVTYVDPGSLEWNVFGWVEWASGLIRPHLEPRPLWHRALRKGLRVGGRLVAAVVGPYERRRDRGATYTVVLRKRALPT